MGIIAAPAGLCLTAYMNSFEDKSFMMVVILLLVSQFLYWAIIFKLPIILKEKFYPSFSGFTFPLVNTTLALTLVTNFLNENNINIIFLDFLVRLETLIAVIVVLYVFSRYLIFLISQFRLDEALEKMESKN